MVKLVINGEEREINPKDYKNFGELLDEIQKEFKDKVLAKVVVNGKEVPMIHIDELRGAILDEEGLTIELEYKPLKEFLLDMLQNIIKYLDNVLSLLPKVSEDMIVDTEKGYNAIKDLSEGLSAVEDLRKNTEKISNLSPKDVGLSEEQEGEVVGILKDFVDSLEKRDIIELSDIIEYQLPKVLKYYKEYFGKVKDILEQQAS